MEIQKAKIVDLNTDYAVVLTDCGAFKRIVRRGNMSVGGGIYITDEDLYMNISTSKAFKRPLFSKRLLQMTGVMALLIMILFTQSFTPMSYAVISVDINPSIQMFIDSDYNVVKIESMNTDGKKLLSEYEFVKKKSASSVLTELFTLAKQMDYLKSEQNDILVSAAIYEPSKSDRNNLQIGEDTDKLIDAVLSEVDYSVFEQESVVINVVASNAKNIEAAEKEHLTIGQFEKEKHSETVKTYILVEDGKIRNDKTPNDNTNTPAVKSHEEIDDKGKVRDRDKVKDNEKEKEDNDKENDNDKEKDNNKEKVKDNDNDNGEQHLDDSDDTYDSNRNDNDTINNDDKNNDKSNDKSNDKNKKNGAITNGNNANGNGNTDTNNSDNDTDHNNDRNNNNRKNKPNTGIDNVRDNVENSNYSNKSEDTYKDKESDEDKKNN